MDILAEDGGDSGVLHVGGNLLGSVDDDGDPHPGGVDGQDQNVLGD